MRLSTTVTGPDRPWMATALTGAAGVELAYFPLHRPEFISFQGTAATSTLLIAGSLVGCAAYTALRPHLAAVSGTIAILLALVSFPLANLGGFFVGMLLAIAGGALAVGWHSVEEADGTDDTPPDPQTTHHFPPPAASDKAAG